MSFDALENSREESQVLELYTFVFGAETFRFTSYNNDIVWAGLSYTATQISRTATQNSVEDAINQLTIIATLDNPVAQKFINNVPGSNGSVQVLRANANDVLEETIVEFEGFVASVKFDGELEAQILCNPSTNVFKRTGPRYTYQGICNHILYDARCKIARPLFTFSGLVSSVSGSQITVNGLSAKGVGWSVGGFVQAPTGAPVDKRMILEQSGDTITLLLPFSIAVLGTTVDVLAGCLHSLAICDSKFSNVINYGGHPYVPRKNPFNSTLRGGS
jgi:uncharacterized phage protein (TIGR02218 family)